MDTMIGMHHKWTVITVKCAKTTKIDAFPHFTLNKQQITNYVCSVFFGSKMYEWEAQIDCLSLDNNSQRLVE